MSAFFTFHMHVQPELLLRCRRVQSFSRMNNQPIAEGSAKKCDYVHMPSAAILHMLNLLDHIFVNMILLLKKAHQRQFSMRSAKLNAQNKSATLLGSCASPSFVAACFLARSSACCCSICNSDAAIKSQGPCEHRLALMTGQ